MDSTNIVFCMAYHLPPQIIYRKTSLNRKSVKTTYESTQWNWVLFYFIYCSFMQYLLINISCIIYAWWSWRVFVVRKGYSYPYLSYHSNFAGFQTSSFIFSFEIVHKQWNRCIVCIKRAYIRQCSKHDYLLLQQMQEHETRTDFNSWYNRKH
jgi:hypothetical protein